MRFRFDIFGNIVWMHSFVVTFVFLSRLKWCFELFYLCFNRRDVLCDDEVLLFWCGSCLTIISKRLAFVYGLFLSSLLGCGFCCLGFCLAEAFTTFLLWCCFSLWFGIVGLFCLNFCFFLFLWFASALFGCGNFFYRCFVGCSVLFVAGILALSLFFCLWKFIPISNLW